MKIVRVALGCLIVGAGVSLVLAAGVGVDPYTLLVDGVAAAFGFSVGVSVLLCGLSMTSAAWALGRPPNAGIMLTIGLVGAVVEAVGSLDLEPGGLVQQVGLFVLGVVAIGGGIGLYRTVDWAEGPLDSLPQAIIDRGAEPNTVFIGVQLMMLVAGWLLGGSVGIGTAAAALAIGPIALRSEQALDRVAPNGCGG